MQNPYIPATRRHFHGKSEALKAKTYDTACIAQRLPFFTRQSMSTRASAEVLIPEPSPVAGTSLALITLPLPSAQLARTLLGTLRAFSVLDAQDAPRGSSSQFLKLATIYDPTVPIAIPTGPVAYSSAQLCVALRYSILHVNAPPLGTSAFPSHAGHHICAAEQHEQQACVLRLQSSISSPYAAVSVAT